MKPAIFEHINITVSNPDATAAWLCDVFGWHIRWRGPSMNEGLTVHVGTEDRYIALYSMGQSKTEPARYVTGSLNHVALIVDDLVAAKAAVEAAGFTIGSEQTYDPGARFYFYDDDGIEYEIVSYA